MLNLDNALRLYTDCFNKQETVDLTYFKVNLTQDDYMEFIDLIEFVVIAQSIKDAEEFVPIFNELDSFKNELYGETAHEQSVVNFKSETPDVDDSTLDYINRLFDEEFDDDAD